MGRGGPLTAGPELRCFSGPRAEEAESTGRKGIGREKSSHPHQARVQSGRVRRAASARETLRAKWRPESEASTQPARTPPPAARGSPTPTSFSGLSRRRTSTEAPGTCSLSI